MSYPISLDYLYKLSVCFFMVLIFLNGKGMINHEVYYWCADILSSDTKSSVGTVRIMTRLFTQQCVRNKKIRGFRSELTPY